MTILCRISNISYCVTTSKSRLIGCLFFTHIQIISKLVHVHIHWKLSFTRRQLLTMPSLAITSSCSNGLSVAFLLLGVTPSFCGKSLILKASSYLYILISNMLEIWAKLGRRLLVDSLAWVYVVRSSLIRNFLHRQWIWPVAHLCWLSKIYI